MVPKSLNSTYSLFLFPMPFSTEQLASPMDAQMCFPNKFERVKKRVVWGVEVPLELQWKGWDLGKEITKNLVLKNLSLKTQKMKYR